MERPTEVNTSVADDRFQELITQRDRLYRAVALAVGDVGLASDAIDEAMTRAFIHWDRIGAYSSPEGWVYRVAMNVARSALRRSRREDLWDRPPEMLVVDGHPDLELRVAIGSSAREVPECRGGPISPRLVDSRYRHSLGYS